MLGLRCCMGFFLLVASGGYSLVAVLGLLIAVASLAEHRLQGTWLQWLRHVGSVFAVPGLQSVDSLVAHGLCCSTACGIFLDLGWNSCLLHWQADSLPLSHQDSLECIFDEPKGQNFEYIPAVILV